LFIHAQLLELRVQAASPATAISPTGGTGSPASLGTVITSGASTIPTNLCTGNCVITGGTRAGNNVFHSFGNFDIAATDGARFQTGLSNPVADASVANILARVTGGPSSIYGNLNSATFYPAANLFLMNPAGFLFGPNATVNVGGMVSVTSADYLRLQDIGGGNAGIFHADTAKASVLTTAPVAAYGFLGSSPGAITVRGTQLTVTPGISFVGGNISIQSSTPDDGAVQAARLSAPGGQVNLASVASPGEILAGNMAQGPNINGQSFGNLGAVEIKEQSIIDVTGNGGGTVLIRGGQFMLDNSTISANVTGPGSIVNTVESIGQGIDIQVNQNAVIQNAAVLETNIMDNATPGVQYGGVHVKADQIQIIGSLDFDTFPVTGVRSDIAQGSTGGNSGNILLEGNTILVQDLGTFTTTLETTTGGAGNAGNIVLTGNNNITLDGPIVQTMSQSSSGNAGNISLSSAHGDIVVKNDPLIQSLATSGSGSTGTISFVAQRDISISTGPFNATAIATSSELGSGNAGNIQMTSTEGNISLTGGPIVSSQTFGSTGVAGNIIVNAPSGDVLMEGGALSGSVGTALRPPTGQNPHVAGSGAIEVTARNLTVHNTAILADNLSSLEPGDVTINLSGTLTLTGTFTDANGALVQSLIQTTSRRSAPSSDINITAHDVHVSDGAFISTDAFASGNAGNLTIHTQNLQLTSGGQVRSGSVSAMLNPGLPPTNPTGEGGTITVQGPNGPATSVFIDGSGSGFFTTTEGTGVGGTTNISTQSLTIQNGGAISAATSGTAPSATGGTITINANQVQVNSGGIITAETTGAGAGGSVNITAANSFSSNGGTVSSATTEAANGGNINIAAGNSATLTNGATISASSTGQGSAGDIHINAGNFTATNSSVTTEATQSTGGIIKITTSPAGTVQLTDSKISASVLDGSGGGGSVNIDPQFVILENSQIIANSVFGPGGNINITTNLLLPDTASIISASSQFGQQGNIVIQSPISPASGKLVPLGQKPLIATTLLGQRCAALAGGNISSFTVAGRDALPAEPGGWMSTPLAFSMGEPEDSMAREARDVREETNPFISLRKIAPIGFLTQSFAPDSSDCQS
jgi:filamentous hemagglutinin family protein